MTGRSQIWSGSEWINLSNNPGSKGETGDTGPPGDGGGVSTDAGNQAVLGSDSLVFVPEFADGVYLKLSGGTLTGALTQQPGAIVNNALAGNVIQRWNGDGNAAARHYEWRRGSSFAILELYGITVADVDVLLMTFSPDVPVGGGVTINAVSVIIESELTLESGGVVESPVPAGAGVGQIRNIHRSTIDPQTGDGNHGDTWYVY